MALKIEDATCSESRSLRRTEPKNMAVGGTVLGLLSMMYTYHIGCSDVKQQIIEVGRVSNATHSQECSRSDEGREAVAVARGLIVRASRVVHEYPLGTFQAVLGSDDTV